MRLTVAVEEKCSFRSRLSEATGDVLLEIVWSVCHPGCSAYTTELRGETLTIPGQGYLVVIVAPGDHRDVSLEKLGRRGGNEQGRQGDSSGVQCDFAEHDGKLRVILTGLKMVKESFRVV